jgi:cytochrome c peroxidase
MGKCFRLAVLLTAALVLVVIAIPFARTQSGNSAGMPGWMPMTWLQALRSPTLPSILRGTPPATLPATMNFLDPSGVISTYRSDGLPVNTSQNSFFSSLGTNGRTCMTCHEPNNGWSITPGSVLATYLLTLARDPLFAPVDGADCPDRGAAATKFGSSFISARTQLFTRGNFRISLPVPTTHDWYSVTITADPTGCERSQTYGLSAGLLSFYRRPLPATNVAFLGPGGALGVNIMWDTREPNLESQFLDATLVHAQAGAAQAAALEPNPAAFPDLSAFSPQLIQGATFQQANFTAQSYDLIARDLTGSDASGAMGGPANLLNFSVKLPPPAGGFGIGNCFMMVPPGTPCPGSFDINFSNGGTNLGSNLYGAFANATAGSLSASMRQSIARGEALYNGTDPQRHGVFTIDGVTGLTDLRALGNGNAITNGTCTTCHNNVNVGNDDFLDPKHIGIGDNSYITSRQAGANGSSTLPPTSDKPLFTFMCPQSSIPFFSNPVIVNGVTYDQYQTTDPGVGWITGKCSDLGKFKVPVLRGLASRAPFFHGGEAATMRDVVLFYQNRFNMQLTDQDIQDLVNFMNSL